MKSFGSVEMDGSKPIINIPLFSASRGGSSEFIVEAQQLLTAIFLRCVNHHTTHRLRNLRPYATSRFVHLFSSSLSRRVAGWLFDCAKFQFGNTVGKTMMQGARTCFMLAWSLCWRNRGRTRNLLCAECRCILGIN